MRARVTHSVWNGWSRPAASLVDTSLQATSSPCSSLQEAEIAQTVRTKGTNLGRLGHPRSK